MRRALLSLAMSACLLQACSRPEPPPEVTEEEHAYGAAVHPELLAGFGGPYRGEEAAYVAAVGERVAAAAGLPGQCTFTLVNSDVPNAFAVPGCFIYVTRGLLAIVTSEAELASVLGHEVGHIAGRHAQRQERRSIWRTLGVIAASVTGSERLTRLANQAAQYLGQRYSRAQEYEADDLSVDYLRRAGYDVYEAADMLAALQRQEQYLTATSGRDSARGVPEWALSHPLTKRRIERAQAAARKTGLADNELPDNAARYFAEVDGLLYGDDPEQGFVLGRRFAHPIMRISFEAPPGFSLTNAPDAISIQGPDGISGEFGGGPLVAGNLGLYAERLAAHIVGAAHGEVADVTRTVINGLPAIIMQINVAVQNGYVPLAIAVYDGGDGQAYHFIIASPPADRSAAAIASLFRSFRMLTPAEAAALRPRFVRTVIAGQGDTTESLVRRVADPAPRALFELLNGRPADQPIRPGEPVKIVTFAGSN